MNKVVCAYFVPELQPHSRG